MDGKLLPNTMNTELNSAELLPRNPYCSNEATHCSCRLPPVAFQPQWVAAKPWSLWKTFLACLLACLIATTLVVLVVYFVHFGKPTVIIQSDGRPSHAIFTSGPALPSAPSTPSPSPSAASPTLHGSQSSLPTTPVTKQNSSTTVLPSATETTTVEHEVLIEDSEG